MPDPNEKSPAPQPAPPPPKFAAVGMEVRRGDGVVAYARSGKMAQRIANALNRYLPSKNGR